MSEPKPPTPVLIAVPVRRFDLDDPDKYVPEHLKVLLAKLTSNTGLPWAFEMMMFGGGNVSRGRNKITATFLRGPWKWLFFIDDDVVKYLLKSGTIDVDAMVQAVIKILARRLHVCGGLYVTKEPNCRWVANQYREPTIDATGLLPVSELGAGFKCYHRSVFETIIAKEPDLDYFCDDTAAPEWALFCQGRAITEGRKRFLPEDYWMDMLCRKHGIQIYADTTIQLHHRDTDGTVYPLEDDWPDMLGPISPITPPITAEDLPAANPIGKLVICLQHWARDREAAARLARFMAKLEPRYREDVELCLVNRHDCHPLDDETCNQLVTRFHVSKVTISAHQVGYPRSPNYMVQELMQNAPEYFEDADGILLMESDCVPMARDWIDQLKAEWARAWGSGKLLMGSWRAECTRVGHINGNMVFHPLLAHKVPLPLPTRKAWDVAWVPQFKDHWCQTGLIANRYCEMFVTEEQIHTPECGTRPPVLVHGIKDNSAWKVAEKLLL